MPEVFVIEPRKIGQTAKKRVCAYARVSTEEESQINSYEVQISYYKDLILKKPEWVFVEIYSDKVISGTSAQKRPGFQQMISDCQAGEIDIILVKSVSRFARNIEECLFYIRELKKLHVNVIFEKEAINTKDLDDELLLTFFGSLSEEESRSISRNIRWSFQRRMEQGLFITACAPYGYSLSSGTLIVNEQEKPVVQWIYDRYLNGWSCQQIADTLNYFSVSKNKNNGIWTESGIYYMLSNEKYIGDALLQKTFTTNTLPYKRALNQGELGQFYVENSQEAILEKETAEKAKRLLKSRKRAEQVERQKRLLSDKVYCGECGTKMRYKTRGETVYWVCQLHVKEKDACSIKEINENVIYEAFMRMYHKLKINYKKVLVPAQQQMELLYHNDELHTGKIETDKKIMQIQKQIQVLNRLQSQRHFESAVFMEKIRELTEQLKTVQKTDARKFQENKVLNKIRTLMISIEKGPERMESISEPIFQKIVEKIVITEEQTIVFYLMAGFQFEERMVLEECTV